ncbi:hypothetical protein [Lentzea sp. NPDC059081]|uniref:hypothetical protein n=1 Tax=Lentzea sp. NPDC059081 TaxID=3346719 RepID=UPI00367BD815
MRLASVYDYVATAERALGGGEDVGNGTPGPCQALRDLGADAARAPVTTATR